MKPATHYPPGNHQRGMTLVELMIAVLIGLFLTAGLLHLFTGSKATYNVLAGVSEIQEGGRISTERLKQKIRMTGYMGCSNLNNIEANIVVSPQADAAFAAGNVIFGENAVNDGSGGVVDDTDTLTITTSTSADTTVADMAGTNGDILTNANPNSYKAGDILVITDCENADVFTATSVADAGGSPPYTIKHAANYDGGQVNSPTRLSRAYLSNALLMRMQNVTFSVRQTSRNDNAGNPIFALYETPAGGAANEIITGVEDMQIAYGEDTGVDGLVDTYVTANDVNQWSKVVSVRLTLLISSANSVGNQPRDYRTLDPLAASGTATPADNRIRRSFTTTIGLRNRTP